MSPDSPEGECGHSPQDHESLHRDQGEQVLYEVVCALLLSSGYNPAHLEPEVLASYTQVTASMLVSAVISLIQSIRPEPQTVEDLEYLRSALVVQAYRDNESALNLLREHDPELAAQIDDRIDLFDQALSESIDDALRQILEEGDIEAAEEEDDD